MRDLAKDLELCNAATPGPWSVLGGDYDWCVTDATRTVICDSGIAIADAHFIAAAREGWPEAIQRAMAAEAKAKELENELVGLAEAMADAADYMSGILPDWAIEHARNILRRCGTKEANRDERSGLA